MEALRQDLTYAVRTLAKTPAFTGTAVLILAIGLGACATIFTLVEGVMLRPLPYPQPDRLVMVWETTEREPGKPSVVSPANAADWRQQASSLTDLAVFNLSALAVPAEDGFQRIAGAAVSGAYFDVLGVRPQAGRPLSGADDVPNGPRVIVLSYDYWQRRFGGDPRIVGSQFATAGRSYEVVGVMPPGFQGPEEHFFGRSEFWIPLQMDMRRSPRGGRWMRTVARLRDGATLQQARDEMTIIAARLAAEYPGTNRGDGAMVVPLHTQVVGGVRPTLLVLFGAVGLLQLIVCANLASLLLSRGVARTRELALRAALGAGRWRLVQGVAIESLVLATAGALLAILIAAWTTPAVVSLWPALPRAAEVTVGGRVILFTFVTAVVTSLVFGLLPGISLSRVDPWRTLRESGRIESEGRRRRRVRFALVVAEVAVSLALLIAGGLLLRNLVRLTSRDPGFNAAGVLTARLELPGTNDAQTRQVLRDVGSRLRTMPGVEAGGAVTSLPFYGLNNVGLTMTFQTLDRGDVQLGARYRAVTGGYLKALGLRLREGRLLDESDRQGAPGAVLVNTELARQVFKAESPLGRTVTVDFGERFVGTIVGVIDPVRHEGFLTDVEPEVYVPYDQHAALATVFVAVRTTGDPAALIAPLRAAAHAAHPRLIVEGIQPLDELIGRSVAAERFNAAVMGVLAAVALILALVGLYAVVAYGVAQRVREIGIRLALGARPAHVLRHVLWEGLWLTGAGIGAGWLIAIPLTASIATLLVDVEPRDPLTYVAVSAAVAAVALLASYVPARRASHVDPMDSLRID